MSLKNTKPISKNILKTMHFLTQNFHFPLSCDRTLWLPFLHIVAAVLSLLSKTLSYSSQPPNRLQTFFLNPRLAVLFSTSLPRMASQLVPCFHITVILLCFTVGRSDISCRNEAGEAVDWWVEVTFFIILLLCGGRWYWGTKRWIRWSPIFS